MQAAFDLAIGLLRPTPVEGVIHRGIEQLAADLESTTLFDGDMTTFWSPFKGRDEAFAASGGDWMPVRSIAPGWLSRMARPGAGESPLEGILYQIYCRSLDTLSGRRPFDHFHRTPIPAPAMGLCIDLLTLGHFPRRFLPEIIGVTLAHESMDSGETPPSEERHRQAVTALETAMDLGLDTRRIRQGYALYRSSALRVFSGPGHITRDQTQREAFARVVAEKAPSAKGYHAKVQLEGRSLDEWFENHGEAPAPLLVALEKSPLVDRACPLGSRFIKAMNFGGPMFGVFDPKEQETAQAWITSPELATGISTRATSSGIGTRWRESHHPSSRRQAKGIRKLFHHLVAAENSIELPREGIGLIHRILWRTRRLQQIRLLPKPFNYEPARLDQFLDDRHRAALQPPKQRSFLSCLSRADWCWTLTQLSPAVLVDGAWLAGVASMPGPPQAWHLELIKIHEDELGNGNPTQNHPRIYRRLLESLDVHLPEIVDPAFSDDRRIQTSAFTFPAYMVAMGWHYAQFEPECLGLNLAIELSGLGSGYQRAIESLRQARIDPLIAELHLSIDNLASGHARRARDAIVLYLENVSRMEGPQAEARAWKRIHQGFLSYRVGLFGLGVSILSRYLISGNIKICK